MKLLLSTTIFIIVFSLQAEMIIYEVDEGDTLDTIVQEKLGEDELSHKDYNIAEFKIKRYNPNIKDWNNIQEGVQIFLSPPISPNIANFSNAYLQKSCDINRKIYGKHPDYKPAACR